MILSGPSFGTLMKTIGYRAIFQESFVFSLVLPVINRLSIGPLNKKEIPILQKQCTTLASTFTFLKCDDGKSSMKWSSLDGTFNMGSFKTNDIVTGTYKSVTKLDTPACSVSMH